MSIGGRLVAALVAAFALALPLAAVGCKGDDARKPPMVTAVAAVPVTILVDDREVAASVQLGGEPRPLTELAPGAPALADWVALEVIDATGKVHTTMTPAKNEAGKVPMLAVGADGIELGFRPTGATGPLADPLRAVSKVTIKTRSDAGQVANQVGHAHGGDGDSGGGREHGGEARPAPGADLKIAITGARGEWTFTGDKLAVLPVIKAPTGDTETPGWSLFDVLTAAGISKPEVVHLTDGEGATLRLDGKDFDPANAVLYLKLNRSGVIRFRLFRRVGDNWEVGGELRGITKIHIVK